LRATHNRTDFQCEQPSLQRYLREQASQDIRRDVTRIVVTTLPGTTGIVGYYSLSSHSLDAGELPEAVRRKLPRYAFVPAVLIGRLARDLRYRGTGIGQALLMDALTRSEAASREVGAWAVVVEAIDQAAERFYASFGFESLSSAARRLYLPMGTVRRLVSG
jgi:predicted GNAT family N-acyltransferase